MTLGIHIKDVFLKKECSPLLSKAAKILEDWGRGSSDLDCGVQKLMVHYITSGMHKNEFNLPLNSKR